MLNKNSILTVASELLLLGLLAGCGPPRLAILAVAMDDDIISLDPHEHDDEVTGSVLFNIYQGLVSFDPQMRIVPQLAQSWENPNDLVWRFHLRPGVRFHDGQALTAGDVVFSLERARRGKLGHYLASIDRLIAVDDLIVEIHTQRPIPVLLNKLTFIAIVPRSAPDSIVRPVGTGPYRFLEYRAGSFLSLEANADYRAGPPAVRRVVFKVITTPTKRLQALAEDSVQLVRFIQLRDTAALARRGQLRFTSLPGLGVTLLGVNFNRSGPLRDARVRQAIFWALDPQRIIDDTKIEARPIGQLVSPYVVGYLPGQDAARPQPELAKKLLQQAGYGRGFPLTIEISTSAANKAQAIAQQLEQLGIRATVAPMDWAALTDRLNRQESPFFLVGWSCNSGDASDLLDACLHSGGRSSYGSANWTGYRNPSLDRDIEQSDQMLDTRQRILLLNQIMERVMSEMPMIPLYVRSQTYGYRQDIGFTPRQDGMVLISEITLRR